MKAAPLKCPVCGSVNDGLAEVTPAGGVEMRPAPMPHGAFLVCAYCVAPMVADAVVGCRLPTEREALEMQNDEGFRTACTGVALVRVGKIAGWI